MEFHYKAKKSKAINKNGTYNIEIISANRHISKQKREGILILAQDLKSKLYLQFYLMIQTPKGRQREKDYNLLQKFMNLGGIFETLEPVAGWSSYYDFKNHEIAGKEGIIYPALIGKRYWVEIGMRYSYIGRITYQNYTIIEVYHGKTQQTEEEFLNNQVASKFKEVVRENRKQTRRYFKHRFSRYDP